jgi:hypothetical protein
MLHHRLCQAVDDVVRIEPQAHPDSQALLRILVDHGQHPERPPLVGRPAHEVIAPHVVAMLRPQPNAGAVVQPQPSSWPLPAVAPSALPAPDPLHPILAYVPFAQQHRDPKNGTFIGLETEI